MIHDLCYQEAEFYRHIGKFQRNLLHPIQVTELAAKILYKHALLDLQWSVIMIESANEISASIAHFPLLIAVL
jgi:hypothetical protein